MSAPNLDELIKELTSNQNRLYGYILTLLPDRDRARDVLQETNLVIWRKAAEFTPGTNFWAWATRIAHFQTMSYYRDAGRERLIFDEPLLERLKVAAEEFSGDDDRCTALLACIAKLGHKQQRLLVDRYRMELPLEEIAHQSGRTVVAVRMALLRIRQTLLECIRRRLEREVAT